ncbi:MAG: UDP-3-O-(3-hydroxymyristoyl)glucosamine N-acyltransferase [Ramlibacter sp.]|nr:UDP-3-O-(3-hydroxymyristoyl)glucosamine N-acyltransferase [Ramlibacter sp.]
MARQLKSPAPLNATLGRLGLEPLGSPLDVTHVGAIAGSQAGQLCFVKAEKFVADVSPGAIVICPQQLAESVRARGAHAVPSPAPRLDFARALADLESCTGFTWSVDAPTIHPTATIGCNVVLGKGVHIGAGTRVLHNVVIGDEVAIGERCLIKSGAIIGEEGFGFERDANGAAVRLPHIGGVLIEDDVEVGSLTTVCRGTLGHTVIRRGAKIDDHVHIAHNVDVGPDAFVIACAEISGGVIIGQGAWIAPCVTVKNQVRIGDRAVIGLGAVVLKDVDPDSTIVGNPGKPLALRKN